MASQHTGLGKGLGALIRETSTTRVASDVHTLPIKDLVPNVNQPRRTFTEKSLTELADSIKVQGVLQPILVRPLEGEQNGKYEIIAGERRWRASKLAGLVEVPVYVKTLSNQETLAAALVENIQREDLNPIEEALAIQTLKDSFALSQEDLAVKLGKSRSAIANSLRLLALPESLRKDIVDGLLSAGHARALLSISETKAQEYLRNLVLEENLSVREAEGLAATWKQTGSFVVADVEALVQGAINVGGVPAPAHDSAAAPTLAEPAAKQRAKPQSQALLHVQTQVSQALGADVKVTGKETKGKISITYTSKEELEALLQKLSGLQPLE